MSSEREREVMAENADLRGVIKSYGDDPDYARSRFRQIETMVAQRAHDRLKIRGLEAEIERLRTALAAREGGSDGLSVPELEDCALACEAFGKNAGTRAGDAWQRLADKCSRAARLRTGTET